jgi:cytidine deaminase
MSEKLFESAKAAMSKAYCPYSQFPVGASVLTASGAMYSGCNVENASYPEGHCAETSAIAHMISATDTPEERVITEVAVIAANQIAVTPCGGCRQRLREFGRADTKVHLCGPDGIIRTVTLGDLLPESFGFDGPPQ